MAKRNLFVRKDGNHNAILDFDLHCICHWRSIWLRHCGIIDSELEG